MPELLQEVAAASAARADSTRILAASDRVFRELRLPRWDPAGFEHTVVALRRDLGDAAFDRAWGEGAALPEEEAVALAARCLDSPR
jgi:hypothetical protein